MKRWMVDAATLPLLFLPCGCLEASPFDTEPPAHDLTRANLEALPPPDAVSLPFKFAAIGDTHSAYDQLRTAVDALNRRNDLVFVAVAGDITNQGLSREYTWTHDELSRLKHPYFVSIGNHDAISKGAELYREVYGPDNFTFRLNRFQFIFYNSNNLEFPGSAPDVDWMNQVHNSLSSEQQAIWITHHNPGSPDDTPGANTRAYYEDLVRQFPVELMIHGHLAEYKLRLWNEEPLLQLSTFQVTGYYTIVTVTEQGFEYERCQLSSCETVEPPSKDNQ